MSVLPPPRFDDPHWPRAGNWPGPQAVQVAGPGTIGIIGIGTYKTSLSASGAHATPAAIRSALRYYCDFAYPELASTKQNKPDTNLQTQWVDYGDISNPDATSATPDNPWATLSKLNVPAFTRLAGPLGVAAISPTPAGLTAPENILDGESAAIWQVAQAASQTGLLLQLGGDNAATVAGALGSFWGNSRAALGKPKDVDFGRCGLITVDAHHDLRNGINNGSPVRRLIAAGLPPQRIVQLGISDFANSPHYAKLAAELGITVIPRQALNLAELPHLVSQAVAKAGAGGGSIHVDIDVDVCDRSVAPACPAALPGGISAWELRQLTRLLAQNTQVRSIDFTEIDATTDAPGSPTVRLAALCMLEAATGFRMRSSVA